MHNGKVHDIGPPQMTGINIGTIQVLNMNKKGDHHIRMPRKRLHVYFEYENEVEKFKPGQLVSFNIVNKNGCLFATKVDHESLLEWDHFNPIRGYARHIVLAILAAVLVLFASSCILNFLINSPSLVIPLLTDCQFNWISILTKLFFSIFVLISCQYWTGARSPKSGIWAGLKIGPLLGIVILLSQWTGRPEMGIWSFLIELIKFSIIFGLVSSVMGTILGHSFKKSPRDWVEGDHH